MRHLYSLLFILLAGVLCSFSCTINLNLKRVQGDGNIINEAPYLKIETDQNIITF